MMNIGDKTYHAVNGRFYSKFYGKTFLLVYHFNYKLEDVFENDTEALKSSRMNKYSIIGELSDYFKINEKFEFLLWYPTFTNHWRQSINPVLEKETNSNHDKNATGYEPLHIGSTSNFWGGLVYSSMGHKKGPEGSLLDGSTYHINWYYSIAPFYPNIDRKFPGGVNGRESEAALWVRAPITLSCKFNQRESHLISVIAYVFVILCH